MRFGCNLVNGKVEGSKVGCAFAIDFKKKDGGSFMSDDVFGHLCTNYGSKWQLDGRYFDGVDDYMDCGENVRPVSAVSVSARLKPIAFQQYGTAISAGRSGGYMLFYPSDPDVKFYVYTTAWQSISIPQADISLNNWHQFILTYDQTNLKIFMNGVEKGSIPLSGNITYDGKPCIIGGYVSATPPYAPSAYFKGLIDEVRIYNRALTAEEIKAHWLGSRVPKVRQL